MAFLVATVVACGPAIEEAGDDEPTAQAREGSREGDRGTGALEGEDLEGGTREGEEPEGAGQEGAESWPEPDPADVESVDAIVAALYGTISGPAGEPRDWDRFRSLFHPEARLMVVGRAPDRPEAAPVMAMTVDDYIERSRRMFDRSPFYETELGRTQAGFRNMVQILSAYESRPDPEGEPFQRGVNGIQLLDDGDRWLILNLYWQPADEDHPIPETLLGAR